MLELKVLVEERIVACNLKGGLQRPRPVGGSLWTDFNCRMMRQRMYEYCMCWQLMILLDVCPIFPLESFPFDRILTMFPSKTPNGQGQKRPILKMESQYVGAAAVATTRKLHCCMILGLVSGPAHERA